MNKDGSTSLENRDVSMLQAQAYSMARGHLLACVFPLVGVTNHSEHYVMEQWMLLQSYLALASRSTKFGSWSSLQSYCTFEHSAEFKGSAFLHHIEPTMKARYNGWLRDVCRTYRSKNLG